VAVATAGTGFYPQPNEWTCGPFALKHALLALGRMVDVTQIAQTAKTHWWSGTDEIQLARAANFFLGLTDPQSVVELGRAFSALAGGARRASRRL